MSITLDTILADDVGVLGEVNESLLSEAYLNVIFSSDRTVYALDRTGTSLAITDATTAAISGVANSFSPFGNNPIPTAATLRVYDSTDGVWATNALTITAQDEGGNVIADPADALRSAGWKLITFGTTQNRANWRPTSDPAVNITARKFIRFELDDGGDKDGFIIADGDLDLKAVAINVTTAGGPGSAVKLAEIQVIRRDADSRWADILPLMSGDTSTAYVPPSPDFIPYEGSAILFGFDNVAYALEYYMAQKSGADVDWKYELSGATAGTWLDITDIYVSGNGHLTQGPAASTTPLVHTTSAWTPKSGWGKHKLSLAMEGGTTLVTGARYWLRQTMTTVRSRKPVQRPIYRLRARQYGNANTVGPTFEVAKTIRSATVYLRGAVAGSGDRALHFVNLSSGSSRAVTVPGASRQGGIITANFDNITIPIGDRFGVIVGTGGVTCADALIVVEE